MRLSVARRALAALVALLLMTIAIPVHANDSRSGRADVDTSLPASWSQQNLAKANDAGFTCHRIPALTVANNGWILASWDGRPGSCADAPQPNSIIQRISKDNGATWGKVQVIAQGNPDPNKRGFSDPSYVVDRQSGRIFNFSVMSYDYGWPQRDLPIINERHVMHAVYFYSDDNGQSWTGPVKVTDALNPAPANAAWVARFAASGEGIQVQHGRYAGRLVQQYTVYEKATRRYLAVSLYSDDHGATWKAGQPIGPGMDENKVVELSDGRLMMNSRKSDGTGGRYVAYSSDGGQTWTNRHTDHLLIDPQNNASIIRAFPNAAPGTAKAKVLLFSNSAASARKNGTIRVSYDDGATWSDSKVFAPGSMSYSTMTVMPNGQVGILYEGTASTINFGAFSWAWIGGLGVNLAPGQATLHRGTNQVPVTISSALGVALPAGKLSVTGPNQITATTVEVPEIPAGKTATVQVPVSVPDTYDPAPVLLTASYVSGGATATAPIRARVELIEGETPGANKLKVVLTLKSAQQDYYRAGDTISWWVRVSNNTNTRINAVPRAGDWDNLFPTCRWNGLSTQPQGNYNCGLSGSTGNRPPTLTLTQADIDRGYIVPSQVWAVGVGADTSADSPLQELTFNGERLALPSVRVVNQGPVATPDVIVAGTKLTYKFDYLSTTNLVTTVKPLAGAFDNFLPGATPNCVVSVGGGSSASCATAEYTVTAEDVNHGYVQPSASFAISRVGSNEPLATLRVHAPKTRIVTYDPKVIVAPSATPGEATTVSVSGFVPQREVTVTLDNATVGTTMTDSKGRGELTFTLDTAISAGVHTVGASSGVLSASASINVVTPRPRVQVDPAAVTIGQSFELKGTGFAKNSSVRVELHSTPVLLGNVITTAEGNLSATFQAPNTALGEHLVVVTSADGTKVSTPLTLVAPRPTTKPSPGEGRPLPITGGASHAGIVVALIAGVAGVGLLARRNATR